MAEQEQQQPHQQQALAYLRQHQQRPVDLAGLDQQAQAALAQAALEAHLVQHQRRALEAIQGLERQRLQRWQLVVRKLYHKTQIQFYKEVIWHITTKVVQFAVENTQKTKGN